MTKMTEIKFYVGIEFDKFHNELTLKQLEYGFEEIKTILLEKFEGFTMTLGEGVYKSGDKEDTAIYTVITEDGRLRYAAENVARRIADVLHQDAVLFTVSTIEGNMVKGS